jgi:hypothetical protein
MLFSLLLLFSLTNMEYDADVNGGASTSAVRSSQEICAFLNRFEKEVEGLPSCNDVDELIVSELDMTERKETPKTTVAHSDRYSRKFKEFLRAHLLPDDIETMPASRLNLNLRYFYHELRSDDGELLSPTTLSCARAGIQRYLTSAPINRVVDIIRGVEFISANRMLKTRGTRDVTGTNRKSVISRPKANYSCIRKLSAGRNRHAVQFLELQCDYQHDEVIALISQNASLT